ncbi:hypothetical protein [Nocardia huaxiensis]|nr:hypothetical protein [Nocardia huaxiensis]
MIIRPGTMSPMFPQPIAAQPAVAGAMAAALVVSAFDGARR